MFKRGLHTPAHLFVDNAAYFISSAIYKKRLLLKQEPVKLHLLAAIKACLLEKNWQLNHWVILDNHYHLLAISDKGDDMSKIFRKIHNLSTEFIQKYECCDLPVWWNYWDYCPRDEKDYIIRLNYLLNNPIKHGYVTNLIDYPYSSFHIALEKYGRDALVQQFKDYPEYKELSVAED